MTFDINQFDNFVNTMGSALLPGDEKVYLIKEGKEFKISKKKQEKNISSDEISNTFKTFYEQLTSEFEKLPDGESKLKFSANFDKLRSLLFRYEMRLENSLNKMGCLTKIFSVIPKVFREIKSINEKVDDYVRNKIDKDVTVRDYRQFLYNLSDQKVISGKETEKVLGKYLNIKQKQIPAIKKDIDDLEKDSAINSDKKIELLKEKRSQLEILKKEALELEDFIDVQLAFKYLYHKVLDKADTKTPSLELLYFRVLAFFSIIKDFENLQLLLPSDQADELEPIKKELEFAKNICQRIDSCPKEDAGKRKLEMNRISDDIIAQCKLLNPSKDNLILPGGFYNPEEGVGHIFLYKIEKESNSTYSISIIDTGAEDDQELDRNSAGKAIKYSGIKESDLTPELISSMIDSSRYKSTLQLRYLLNNQIMGIGNDEKITKPHIQKVEGESHRLQTTGTCSIQCLLAWLENRIPKETFHRFEKLMAATAIRDAQKADGVSKKCF